MELRILLALVVAACGGDPAGGAPAGAAAAPITLDFGQVEVGHHVAGILQIRNLCDTALAVDEIPRAPQPFDLGLVCGDVCGVREVPAGGVLGIGVGFGSSAAGSFVRELDLETSRGAFRVRLVGDAVPGGTTADPFLVGVVRLCR